MSGFVWFGKAVIAALVPLAPRALVDLAKLLVPAELR